METIGYVQKVGIGVGMCTAVIVANLNDVTGGLFVIQRKSNDTAVKADAKNSMIELLVVAKATKMQVEITHQINSGAIDSISTYPPLI